MAFLMARESLLGPMVTSMMALSRMARGTALARESTWTARSTRESISRTNRMERVGNFISSRLTVLSTGLYIWKDGERYEGYWGEGKFHGKGIKTLPDGTIFDGDWEEGRPVGQGMCKYPDGAKYTGSWHNG